MNLYAVAVAVAFTITLGGSEPTEWQLDVNPVFYQYSEIPALLPGARAPGGIAVRNFFWVNPDNISQPLDEVMREECLHTQQYSALGPAFLPFYFATLGEPFEPYPIRQGDRADPNDYDQSRMWQADDPMRCPLLRVSSNRGFLVQPCYWELGKALFGRQ